MTPLTFTFPFAFLASDNARHGVLKGRIISKASYRDKKDALQLLALTQRRGQTVSPFTCPVRVTTTLHEPDRRRRDIANYCKLAGDILTGIAVVDDSQIDAWVMVRGPLDKTTPRLVVTVTAIRSPLLARDE